MKWNPKLVIALSTAAVLVGGSSKVAAQTEEQGVEICYDETNANGCLPDIGDQADYCVLKCGGNWQITSFSCVDGRLKCKGKFTPP
jgi:hypothetical protein